MNNKKTRQWPLIVRTEKYAQIFPGRSRGTEYYAKTEQKSTISTIWHISILKRKFCLYVYNLHKLQLCGCSPCDAVQHEKACVLTSTLVTRGVLGYNCVDYPGHTRKYTAIWVKGRDVKHRIIQHLCLVLLSALITNTTKWNTWISMKKIRFDIRFSYIENAAFFAFLH